MTPWLLCDADDCLFGSETPAFEAAAEVVNRLLADHGVDVSFAPEELRRVAAGRNFRANALALAERYGFTIDPDELEARVEAERRAVSERLGRVLRPEPEVLGPLRALSGAYALAAVSSSALKRLEVCFTAAGLDELIPPERRFSAEDSLPEPTSKPDPAIYRHALASLRAAPEDALAVEDSVSGVRSAVGAGIPVVGMLRYVPAAERPERAAALQEAGALSIVEGWEAVPGP